MFKQQVVQNLQVNNEMWNRNIDLLNILTYGDLTSIAGEQRKSLRQLHSACYTVLGIIGPMYLQEQTVDRVRKTGEVISVNANIKGIKTNRFKDRWSKLNKANAFILASENPQVSQYGKYVAAQKAYAIMQDLRFELWQDIEDLGLNKKEKTPGAAAALTGS